MKRFCVDNPERGNFYHLPGPLVLSGQRTQHVDGHEVSVATLGDLTGRWNAFEPFLVGDRVQVLINHMGRGRILGYFIEDGYIGIEVLPDQMPEWYVTQNGSQFPHYMVFPGSEALKIFPDNNERYMSPTGILVVCKPSPQRRRWQIIQQDAEGNVTINGQSANSMREMRRQWFQQKYHIPYNADERVLFNNPQLQ